MNTKENINGTQLIFMLIMFIHGTTVLLPTGTEAKQDIWIVMILVTIYSAILVWIYSALLTNFNGQSLIEILPKILGKYLGKTIGFLYVLFFLHLSALIVRNLSDFMAATLLPETPIVVFVLSYLLLVSYAVRGGLEVIARVGTFSFFIFMTIVAVNIIASSKEMNFMVFLPVMENGIKPILQGLISASGFPFGEILVFLMIIPYLNKNSFQVRRRLTFLGVTIATLILLTLQVRNASILTVLGQFFIYPSFAVINYIQLGGGFLERFEPFFVMAFLIVIFMKLTITFYACVVGFAQLTNLKDYRPLINPLILIIGTLSIAQFETITENAEFARKIYPLYILPLSFIIPLLLLVFLKISSTKINP